MILLFLITSYSVNMETQSLRPNHIQNKNDKYISFGSSIDLNAADEGFVMILLLRKAVK